MKRKLMAIALLCAMSSVALAGDIPSVDLQAHSDDGPGSTITVTSPTEGTNVVQGLTGPAVDLLEVMIGLIL